MEQGFNPEFTREENFDNRLSFHGEGSAYFGIVIVNLLLCILSLGLYYPWAKAAMRRYIWSETELNGSRFSFHGTGKEMFKGFVIVYAFVVGIFACQYFIFTQPGLALVFLGLFYLVLIITIPFGLFGAWRYRVSRTSWRGIFFSFDGRLSEFMRVFYVNLFFTILTLGIYAPWMRVKIQSFLFGHTKFGNYRFGFKGDGGELFGINIIFAILLYPTLFLYTPAYLKNRFNFTVDNTIIDDGSQKKLLRSSLETMEAYKVYLLNALLLVLTLGLFFPWATINILKMRLKNVDIPNVFDFDRLEQDADNYKDATGDQLIDVLDLGLDF